MPRKPRASKPRKGELTEGGLWRLSVGSYGFKVTVRETEPGGPLRFDFTHGGKRFQPRLEPELRVRDAEGGWDGEAIDQAESLAWKKSQEIREGRLPVLVEPEKLTVRQGLRLFIDKERGARVQSEREYIDRVRYINAWIGYLGADAPWNRIRRADVENLANNLRREGKVPTADKMVRILRTAYRWLDEKGGYEGLRDPTKGFAFRKLVEGYKPKRPRYSEEEVRKLIAVRDEVDVRFSLFVALMWHSGARGKALRLPWRSSLDGGRDIEPSRDEAPHGWLVLPALKGQDELVVFLTRFQRTEIERALTGYLRELERRWQRDRTDYPLFPAVRLYGASKQKPIRPDAHRAYESIGPDQIRLWLKEAERLAGVVHVRGRGWHGFRRAVADRLEKSIGLGPAADAMGYKSERTLELIYLEKDKHTERAAARRALENVERKDKP